MKFCTNCGKKISEDSNFCQYCGKKVYRKYQHQSKQESSEKYSDVDLAYYNQPKMNKRKPSSNKKSISGKGIEIEKNDSTSFVEITVTDVFTYLLIVVGLFLIIFSFIILFL